MRSLVLLCSDPMIPEKQRRKFCEDVVGYVSLDLPWKDIALKALRMLWARYDSGGISCGRSLRSALLEKIIHCIDEDKELSTMRHCFSILLGMYHDPEFVNTASWYDYEISHFFEVDLSHRIWLATAAFSLELDEVADMNEWPIERIRILLAN
jgi:hypothetical protein